MKNPLPSNLFTPAFHRQQLGWMLIGIMAIMVYLATLAMVIQGGFSTLLLGWHQDQKAQLTLELPASAVAANAGLVDGLIGKLKAMPEIKQATIISSEETARLLQPWISDTEVLKSLPLPSLIDVTLMPDAGLSVVELHDRLVANIPDLKITDHAEWLAQLHQALRTVIGISWLILGLTFIAVMIAVSLICRAAMAIEQKTLGLLKILGAPDTIIASGFVSHARRLALPAAGLGFVLAIITVALLGLLLRQFIVTPLNFGADWLHLGGAVIAVPVFAVLAAIITARASVLKLLRLIP